MRNLEVKSKMSAIQLAIVVTTTGISSQLVLSSRKIVADAGNLAWLSIILGGLIFYGAALLMVKLGEGFPAQTLLEYMPSLWGKAGSSIIIWWFNLLFLTQLCTSTAAFSKVIQLFLFYRTPVEIIILGLIITYAYCALQDFGTILRVQQLVFWVATSAFIILWLLSLFNFRPESLLPLWKKSDLTGLFSATTATWNMYSGYEIVLLLLPITSRNRTGITKALGGAFLCMCLLFLSIIVIAVGVLTIHGVKNSLYPTMTVISSVEVPGTFIERLDTYLVLSMIPGVFDTMAIFMWVSAQVFKKQKQHADHRPWVFILLPLIYIGSVLLTNIKAYDFTIKVVTWLGIIFSLLVIPLSLVLVWKKAVTKKSEPG